MRRPFLAALSALVLAGGGITAGIAAAVPARAGAPYSCTTSSPQGSCPQAAGGVNYDSYPGFADFAGSGWSYYSPYVDANEWGPVSGQTQTLAANSPGDWQVREYIPAASNTGHAVTTYPNAGMQFNTSHTLTGYPDITSSFADTIPADPANTGWQGYDNWFNNWADEVMIQTQWVNTGGCDYAAVQQFGGSNGVPVQTWGLCDFGGPGGEKVWKLAPPGTPAGSQATLNETSGSVDITAMTDWLVNHGYMTSTSPAATTITALSAGFEICNTAAAGSTWAYTSLTFSTGSPSPSPSPTSTSPSPTTPAPTPTPTSPSPTPVSSSPSPSPTGTSLLAGDSTAEGIADWSNQGQAEAFSYTAARSGTSQTASFYVDPAHSTATAGVLGIYTDSGYNSPGTLLGQVPFTPQPGWNTVTLPGAAVTAGRKYWLAELGVTGQLALRDQGSGVKDEESAQVNLTSLPGHWTDGTAWDSGHASFYVSGS